MINQILSIFTGQSVFEEKENMRSAEEIMKDYGL